MSRRRPISNGTRHHSKTPTLEENVMRTLVTRREFRPQFLHQVSSVTSPAPEPY